MASNMRRWFVFISISVIVIAVYILPLMIAFHSQKLKISELDEWIIFIDRKKKRKHVVSKEWSVRPLHHPNGELVSSYIAKKHYKFAMDSTSSGNSTDDLVFKRQLYQHHHVDYHLVDTEPHHVQLDQTLLSLNTQLPQSQQIPTSQLSQQLRRPRAFTQRTSEFEHSTVL